MASDRIQITSRPGFSNPSDEITRQGAVELGFPLDSVTIARIYEIDSGDEISLSEDQLSLLEKEILIDPIVQQATRKGDLVRDFDWLVEVTYLPGVTDTLGKTAATAIEDSLGIPFASQGTVYTSRQYFLSGDISREQVNGITKDILANDMIEGWTITSRESFLAGEHKIPSRRVDIQHTPTVHKINLDLSDEKLLALSRERSLALNLTEMLSVKDYLERKATDAELELLAQTWSEHCKHTIFNAKITYDRGIIDSLFDTYIRGPTEEMVREMPWVKSIFWDNSGVIEFDDKHNFCIKCETHNSPSNKEPYGGAITGIVGVYRDPMGTDKGASIIFGAYGFFTGDPSYKRNLRPRLHPKRLLEGVRKGVEDGGNKSGIPTPFGLVHFHEGYIGKPAIFVTAAGLIPRGEEPLSKEKCSAGDLIVMAGGRVGIDGIHGATQSSMEAGEWITAGHVQLGDPFTQKKLLDFLNEARDKGIYSGITDNGAGGLSSSVGEMARSSNGFKMDLAQVPLKYEGLDPWQILVSESQERMTLALDPGRKEELEELARKHDVEISVLGEFTDSGKYHVVHGKQTVAYLDMSFVHEGVPQMELEAEWITPEQRGLSEPLLWEVKNKTSFLKKMLARPNIASKEYITRRFDHEVQGTSVVKPLVGKDRDVNSDAVVLAPRLGSRKGIAFAAAANPSYSEIDTYHMAAVTLDEAIRRVITVGGKLERIALNDNFCWPSPISNESNPGAKYKTAQLVRACQALARYTTEFGTPCISGKDSMSMDGMVPGKTGEEQRISALPTLQFSAVGIVDDVEKCVTMDVKNPGDAVYVLGETRDEFGGSEYYEMGGYVGLNVPQVNAASAKRLYESLGQAIDQGLVASAHGVYRGGLAIALAQSAFAGGYGIEIDLANVPSPTIRDDTILFSESASRLVVTVAPTYQRRFEKIMKGNIYGKVGKVLPTDDFRISGLNKREIINDKIQALKEAWQSTYKDY